ncbi:MAG: HU family DNA-binding protein [Bacteroidaceae bacterium]|nr:HU family DNA-binding protein [Bacteroidaceae bacterium]
MAKGKVNLQVLAEMMANNNGRSKASTEQFARAFFATLKDALQRDNIIKIKGFGTFKLVVVSPRESVNVNNGERVNIAGYNKITFTPDKALKDRVNKPFAQFDTMLLEDEDLKTLTGEEVTDVDDTQDDTQDDTEIATPVEQEVVAKEEKTAPAEEKAAPEEKKAVTEEKKPVVEEKVAVAEVKLQETKRQNRAPWIIGIVLLIIGIVIGLLVATNSNKQKDDAEPAKVINADSIAISAKQKAEQDSIAILREAAKDYEQVEDGKYLIAGTRIVRKITPRRNLARYCQHIYGTKDVLPYVMKYNNLKSEYVGVGRTIKFPILIEK